MIISCDLNGKIIFWENQYHNTYIYKGNQPYSSLFLLRNRNRMIAAGFNGEIEIFNLEHKFVEFTLKEGHYGYINFICEIESDIIATGGLDKIIILWNLGNGGYLLRRLEGHEGEIKCLAYIESSSRLLSGSTDHTIRIWNPFDAILLNIITEYGTAVPYQILQLDNSIYKSYAISVCFVNNPGIALKFWDLETLETKFDLNPIFEEPQGFVSAVLVDKANIIILGGTRGYLAIFDTLSMKFRKIFPVHKEWIRHIEFINCKIVITSSSDKTIKISNINTAQVSQTLNGHTKAVYSLIKRGIEIISCSLDKSIIFWTKGFQSSSAYIYQSKSNPYLRLLELKSGNIAATCASGEIHIFDIYTKNIIYILKGHTKNTGIHAFCQLSNGCLVTGSNDKTLKIWDLEQGICIKTLYGHEESVLCAVEHSTGALMSGSGDHSVIIWDAPNYKIHKIYTGYGESIIWNLHELSNGRVVSVCDDDSISTKNIIILKIWVFITGLKLYNVHSSHQEEFGFCSSCLMSGERILVGESSDYSGRLLVYNLENKEFERSYEVHGETITQVQLIGDIYALTCSADRMVKVINLETGEVIITLDQGNKKESVIAIRGE